MTKTSRLLEALTGADAVVVGAGAGLSTSAGFTYSGGRFQKYFADFIETYWFSDMYSAGFYPFKTLEEQWAYWSWHIWYNRYVPAPKDTYAKLAQLLAGKDFFVLTTNVDHQFQLAGFPKERLFYTQGDYGLWQCSQPCHADTYDNYETVKIMVETQHDMRVSSELVPHCPRCGEPMITLSLRTPAGIRRPGATRISWPLTALTRWFIWSWGLAPTLPALLNTPSGNALTPIRWQLTPALILGRRKPRLRSVNALFL